MQSWPTPTVPSCPTPGGVTPAPLALYDTADEAIRPVAVPEQGPVGMYVCGITPYDATHLGHAATYLTFDLICRQLLALGHEVHFVQNITDVDDPLFERAERDQVDWRELGQGQIDLFRADMTDLKVLPPQHYIGVQESIDDVIALVSKLLEVGAAYVVEDAEYPDIYASREATAQFGYESHLDEETMAALFAERGGDPERPGKRDPLDALVWRAARPGEPSWPSPFGPGRPGWHIECAAIAQRYLGPEFAIQGGGSDLVFPHHEFSAAHVEAATGVPRMAGHYVHAGMIALDGVKMSKSLGNLVFVSKLTAAGHEPSAIRLAVFADHYRADRDFSEAVLARAEERLRTWREAARRASDQQAADALVTAVQRHLANDLDTPAALAAIDEWAAGTVGTDAAAPAAAARAAAPGETVARALDALMGITL
ncbi:cysteine--1-D-myo-inosityl 2-amino-2-deoxy-alpha-D-glucopyranoside ligase [Corynebacterium sp. 13CS0277]|uniref:cysteine--1-D-myo-inosityl 2-amino-2-deoxy-alpha-D-glucopyranoside ligase n=1 Tax=Corynebacterium sp. 13CS0277 TaxID=2071994 RepID=UPI000D025382|nr:cysteine--1-D-myo-inosityl 2-amino-2-deoxy-alpha-D-glucopyranoside ligase [Corynebacterium sp. 13CS0277]PRQ12070.1 cysteine--1-D-myo-inosityl 2-amino-2-deoxy-alpha-D-glucopyranoside ligase [Corynebacterium sp. 13CS0277]